jgi:hypothetical protein
LSLDIMRGNRERGVIRCDMYMAKPLWEKVLMK